jgi:hypothetical protein
VIASVPTRLVNTKIRRQQLGSSGSHMFQGRHCQNWVHPHQGGNRNFPSGNKSSTQYLIPCKRYPNHHEIRGALLGSQTNISDSLRANGKEGPILWNRPNLSNSRLLAAQGPAGIGGPLERRQWLSASARILLSSVLCACRRQIGARHKAPSNQTLQG